MKAGFKVTKMFFDKPSVKNAMDKETRKAFRKFGAYVRTRARSSIRRRRKASSPGKPPSSHTGLLKTYIYFDGDEDNVVIGAMPLNMKNVVGAGGEKIPQILEHGGTVIQTEVFKWGKWRRADLRSRRRNAGLQMRKRRIPIAARPFMGPAFEKEKAKLPACWSGTLR